MKMNPVYKRETMVSSRSFKLALILLMFNGILALVALLNMYSTMAQVRVTAEIQYTSFLDLYLFVASLEFMMLVFIMPAITAGSISGERERQTLELMLTTPMTPADIVLGKLASALSTMFLLIVSSFPIIAMVFVYGGVTLKDIGLLLLCLAAAALLMGSIGLCCSAMFGKSTLSTVAAYVVTGIIIVGTYGINQFAHYINGMNVVQKGSGALLYLLLINPSITFLMTISRLTGQEQTAVNVGQWFGNAETGFIFSRWVGLSIAIQFIIAAGFVWAAVKVLKNGKKH